MTRVFGIFSLVMKKLRMAIEFTKKLQAKVDLF
jgi:hypothetical protein